LKKLLHLYSIDYNTEWKKKSVSFSETQIIFLLRIYWNCEIVSQ